MFHPDGPGAAAGRPFLVFLHDAGFRYGASALGPAATRPNYDGGIVATRTGAVW